MRLRDTVVDGVQKRRVAVTFQGEPYWLDISACRRALVCRRAAGDVSGIQEVADQAGVSRSTVSRFLNAHRGGWSIDSVRAILGVLGVRFDDVVTPRAGGR
jgi:transcriptional regulator with XRE-family HTH domain